MFSFLFLKLILKFCLEINVRADSWLTQNCFWGPIFCLVCCGRSSIYCYIYPSVKSFFLSLIHKSSKQHVLRCVCAAFCFSSTSFVEITVSEAKGGCYLLLTGYWLSITFCLEHCKISWHFVLSLALFGYFSC